MHACKYCGTLFESKYHLSQHEEEFKKTRLDDGEEPYENAGFKYIRQKARQRNEKEWVEKVEKYEDEGMDTSAAEEKADDKMEQKDRKRFFKMYSKLVKLQVQLDDCTTHTDLVDHAKELCDVTNLNLDQAIKRAISKRRKDLEMVMEPDLTDEEEMDITDEEDSPMDDSSPKDQEDIEEGEDEQEDEDEKEDEDEEEEEEAGPSEEDDVDDVV